MHYSWEVILSYQMSLVLSHVDVVQVMHNDGVELVKVQCWY
jgi:hypothetical protein